jgi:hypothetical protein
MAIPRLRDIPGVFTQEDVSSRLNLKPDTARGLLRKRVEQKLLKGYKVSALNSKGERRELAAYSLPDGKLDWIRIEQVVKSQAIFVDVFKLPLIDRPALIEEYARLWDTSYPGAYGRIQRMKMKSVPAGNMKEHHGRTRMYYMEKSNASI